MNNIRPRIRLTSFCNGNCPYCFAKEYIASEENYISMDNIKYLVNKLKKASITHVAWQGGEPLIHPQIEEIMKLFICENMKVSIFTNGLFNSRIIEFLQFMDFDMLINVNHPSIYRNDNDFSVIENNIEKMIEYGFKERISLGINYYIESNDFEHIYNLIRKYGIQNIRIDMARPSNGKENIFWEYENISKVFKQLRKIMEHCIKEGARFTHFDCPFPICELEKEDFSYYWRHIPLDRVGKCYTDMDIGSDLKIMLCFCSLFFNDIYLKDFDSFEKCFDYIEKKEFDYRWKYVNSPKCFNCILRELKLCQGGCLGYRKYKIPISKLTDTKKGDLFYFYDLFKNKEKYNIQEFEEKFISSSFEENSIDRFDEINDYYKVLCESWILMRQMKYESAKEKLVKAFETVHYLDVDYIVNSLRFIEICLAGY